MFRWRDGAVYDDQRLPIVREDIILIQVESSAGLKVTELTHEVRGQLERVCEEMLTHHHAGRRGQDVSINL